ncbi:hypothetical protein ABZ154_09385 [Streptomyces sp. NPDC006261]|uniref:hypothetical protein n=1 Tax=Streptomyces sp. NPDC006261 TaxID=3156739 RepID=UPI0033B5A315
MIAWILSLVLPLSIATGGAPSAFTAVAALVTTQSTQSEEDEWEEFHTLSHSEHAEAFDVLFNSYETKWSKNGRLMIRQGSTGPYKFVKRSA